MYALNESRSEKSYDTWRRPEPQMAMSTFVTPGWDRITGIAVLAHAVSSSYLSRCIPYATLRTMMGEGASLKATNPRLVMPEEVLKAARVVWESMSPTQRVPC